MKTLTKAKLLGLIAQMVMITLAGCKEVSKTAETAPSPTVASPAPAPSPAAERPYMQIERLARPAINEGLIISNDNLNLWNMLPPTADLSAGANGQGLNPVATEAVGTLSVLYAGACYLYGALGFTTATAPHPGFQPCTVVGGDTLSTDPAKVALLKQGQKGYVGNIAGWFLPDVMRIDTTQSSGYNKVLCNGAAASSPLICGGRRIDDDVMNITYGLLLAGQPDATQLTGPLAAVTDGTSYAGSNSNQGHKPLLASFPYTPAPY